MTQSTRQLMHSMPAARLLSCCLILGVLLIDLLWLPFSALRIGTVSLAVIIVIATATALAGPIRRRVEISTGFVHLCVEIYLLVLFSVVGFVFSYLAIESGWTVRDELFASIDRFVGFDWRRYTLFVLQNDVLRPISVVLYVMTPFLVGFALVWLCLQGERRRGSELVAMVILGGVLCVILSGLLPGAGGSGYFPTDNSFYEGYRVIFDDSAKTLFFQLRDGDGMEVSFLHPAALIAFPSFHACLALLVVLVLWDQSRLGYPILALNLGALFTLPVQGGHHLVDILGGLLVGAVAYWVVRRAGAISVLRREQQS